MSNGEHSLNSIECLKLVKKLILHIKEMVCCFDLDACVVEKRPYFVAHNEYVVLPQDNAPCHDTRNTLLENDVLGFQRAIHQPYSTDLAPLDVVYVPNLKSYLEGTRFNHETKTSAFAAPVYMVLLRVL